MSLRPHVISRKIFVTVALAASFVACGMTTRNPDEAPSGGSSGAAPMEAQSGSVPVTSGSGSSSGGNLGRPSGGAVHHAGEAPFEAGSSSILEGGSASQGGSATQGGSAPQGGSNTPGGANAAAGAPGSDCEAFAEAWLANNCTSFIDDPDAACQDLCGASSSSCSQNCGDCADTCDTPESCQACKAATAICRKRCAAKAAACARACYTRSELCRALAATHPDCATP